MKGFNEWIKSNPKQQTRLSSNSLPIWSGKWKTIRLIFPTTKWISLIISNDDNTTEFDWLYFDGDEDIGEYMYFVSNYNGFAILHID